MHAESTLRAANETVPEKMKRRYDLFITYKDRKPNLIRAIHEIGADMIGCLTVVKGIVIRADEVKPRLSFATFQCEVCGCENYLEVLN